MSPALGPCRRMAVLIVVVVVGGGGGGGSGVVVAAGGQIHLRTILWVYCTVLDMPESKEMAEQVDWREKQPSQAGCVSEEDRKC